MKTAAADKILIPRQPFLKRLAKDMQKNWKLYALFLPVLVYFFVFKYGPMFGLSISFQDYKPARGFLKSKWVGLKHFENFFTDPYFFRLLKNTVTISLSTLIFSFPSAIILALLINELRSRKLSRVVQTVSYIPHFVSTVVICGIIQQLVGRTGGITMILANLFGIEPTNMLLETGYFIPIYIGSDIWQNMGWNSIVYLSALTAIDQELYEAAKVDGANKWNQMIHITIPCLVPTIIIMFILKVGKMFDVGYEKIMLLYTPLTYERADVINTYVYRRGMENAQWSYSAAVGFFNSVVCFLLVFVTNTITRRSGGNSLW
ncbi:MAG: sugar ABC transporter permease [Clostridia bacterium]|nr:sugar ABC transporter permease [Clostridia bacterium]